MNPFIKWAGGKGQLLEIISSKFPSNYNRYFEPFVGGGAVFLGLEPTNTYINDSNTQLINVYNQIKYNPNELLSVITTLDSKPCDKDLYLLNRSKFNELISKGITSIESAALFIWLNKKCFNGLYRVNKKGLFNVPYNNSKAGKSVDTTNILNISKFLKDVHIFNTDFEDFCNFNNIGNGDLVYFDSPYIPMSETANFTSYTDTGFTEADHRRLSKLFIELDSKGAKIILSNNDTPLTYDLYTGFNIESFDVRRLVNRNSKGRTSREVLITNF